MGRHKSNPADKFPWEDYFAESDVNFQHASEMCQDTSTGADMVRKAANILGYKDTSGTKEENCQKINKQVTIIKERIAKIRNLDEQDRARQTYIEYLKNSLINKVDKADLAVPSKPALPNLNVKEFNQINERFPDVPDVGKIVMGTKEKSAVKKIVEEEIKKMDVDEKKEESFIFNEEEVLEAQALKYIDTVSNSGKKPSVSEFTQIMNIYSGVVGDDSRFFNKTKITEVLKKVIQQVKDKKGIPKSVLSKAESVIQNSLRYAEKVLSPPPRREPSPPPRREPSPERELTDNDILEAHAINYINMVKQKGEKPSVTDFSIPLKVYQNVFDESSVLFNKEKIKEMLKEIISRVKVQGIPDDILRQALKIIERSFILVQNAQPSIPFEIPGAQAHFEIPIQPVVQPVRSESRYSEEDFLSFIDSRGWARPIGASRERLCDYILDQFKKEDRELMKTEDELRTKYDDLNRKMELLIERQEKAVNDLLILKTKQAKMDVKKYEEKKEKLEEKTRETEDKIKKAKVVMKKIEDKQEEIKVQAEKKKEVCFMMKSWMDQDPLNEEVALQDLSCPNNNLCNVEKSECEEKSELPSIELHGRVIVGNQDTLDRIQNKFNEGHMKVRETIDHIVASIENKDISERLSREYTDKIFNEVIKNAATDEAAYGLVKDSIDLAIKEIMEEQEPGSPPPEPEPEPTPSATPLEYIISLLTLEDYEGFVTYAQELGEEFKNIFGQVLSNDEVYTQIFFTMMMVPIIEDWQIDMLMTKKQMEDYKRILDHYKPEIDEDVNETGNLEYEKYVRLMKKIEDRLNPPKPKITVTTEKKRPAFSTVKKVKKDENISTTISAPLPPVTKVPEPETKLPEVVGPAFLIPKKEEVREKSCGVLEITSETDEKSIIADLTCDDGMLCNIETKMCQVPTESDVIVPITVGESIINVIGSTNIINTLKQKIMSATRKDVSVSESKPFRVQSLVKSERATLEDVVRGLKTISGTGSTTIKQSKIKLLEQQAKEKLRKCISGE